jgi:hypothetical protein
VGFIDGQKDTTPTEVTSLQELQNGKYVAIPVAKKMFRFTEGNNSSLHFVWDNNENLYVVEMLPSLAKELETATQENPIKIQGITKKITPEIKEDAIKIFNSFKNLDMEALTKNNFESNVGNVYVFTKEDLTNKWIRYAFAGMFICFTVPFLIAIVFIESKIKRILKKLPPEETKLISDEIEREDTIIFEKANIFLTKNYVISLGKSLDITKYCNIVWVYHTDLRQNGILSNRYINIITNEFKDRSIPTIPFGKSKNIHLEIMDIISKKNSKILIGYTDENVQRMKEVKKEFKQNK